MTGTDLYRNRDFIPDFDAIMEETAARSRETATRAELRRNVAYGPGPRQRLDILSRPKRTTGAPLHMFVHGGYWRAGSKDAHALVAEPVLAAGGIAAIVGYDLMPTTRLGTIVLQVRAAARLLLDMAAGLGADPGRFTVSGHSAGAHLASFLAATGPSEDEALDLPVPKGLLLVSGIYDLSGIPDSFLKDEAKMRQDEAAAWSPVGSRHRLGPHRVITRGEGETRPFQEQALALDALLRQEKHSSELREEAGQNHLTVVLDLADPDRPLGRRLADLVAGC